MPDLRPHALQLHLDGHRVDGAGHDATVSAAGQHPLQHGAEGVDVVDTDVGLDETFLLVLVLFPGGLSLSLRQVFINLVYTMLV